MGSMVGLQLDECRNPPSTLSQTKKFTDNGTWYLPSKCKQSSELKLQYHQKKKKKKKDLKQQQKYLQKQLREELGPEPDLQTGASAGQGSAQPPVPLN
jgi:hypothetical protein